MERALSSWGLSFASQIDFPPLWPGTSHLEGFQALLQWIRHKPNPDLTNKGSCVHPHQNASSGLWMPSLNAGLLFFLTFS